jgi:hypothetical protein
VSTIRRGTADDDGGVLGTAGVALLTRMPTPVPRPLQPEVLTEQHEILDRFNDERGKGWWW